MRSGIPCYNCRLDNRQCTLSDSRKRRQPRSEVKILPTVIPQPVVQQEDSQRKTSDTSLAKFLAHPPQSLDFALSEYVSTTSSPDKVGSQALKSDLEAPQNDATTNQAHSTVAIGVQNAVPIAEPPATLSEVLPNQGVLTQANEKLPAYVRPLPPFLDADDVVYLDRKGVLSLVGRESLRKLLKSFAEFVYPFMPILDLQTFLEPLINEGASGKISLMLLHAVIYAAAAFVDEEILKKEGYGTRREARRLLFDKVKVIQITNSTIVHS